MRTFWWACIGVAVLTCAVAYPLFNQPSLSAASVAPSEQSDLHPFEQNPELPLTGKDEARLEAERVETIDLAPVASEPNQSPDAQKEARLEDTTATVSIQPPERNDAKQDLSYLAYYAYSELPPAIKPAEIVLDSLKDIPRGSPVEEIRRVSSALGLDFTFMKTVAKIESGFDPKQRTVYWLIPAEQKRISKVRLRRHPCFAG